jgi:hypothetical protein
MDPPKKKDSWKTLRFGPRLSAAADAHQGYRDVHVFIGGTGAVGGTAVFKMLDMYEEMFARRPPESADDVPILIATGRPKSETRPGELPDVPRFLSRLHIFEKTKHGDSGTPRKVRDFRLTYAGICVQAKELLLSILDGLGREAAQKLSEGTSEERRLEAWRLLAQCDLTPDMPPASAREQLLKFVGERRPFTNWLDATRNEIMNRRAVGRFRSVTIGIPLPSLLAYNKHPNFLEDALRQSWGNVADGLAKALKTQFEHAVVEDLRNVCSNLADSVFVAHTTAIGGMYDIDPKNSSRRIIRLGFAHSAIDADLAVKQEYAESLTEKFKALNARVLITAAAIGIDEAQIDKPLPLHKDALGALRAFKKDDGVPFEGQRPDLEGCVLRCRPIAVQLSSTGMRGRFKTGDRLQPRFALRSGENGFFSVANTDALYRTMRVATESELGFVLASVALLGDDPEKPWFLDRVCYYTETDNSRSASAFLYQPALLESQLSGLEPMALQDLGSAKHQAELHVLALLILAHRLRTLDWDAIDPYQSESFDAHRFVLDHSRALTFTDVEHWALDTLAKDLAVLVQADEHSELLRFAASGGPWGVFPLRDAARDKILRVVLDAVWNAPSLGTPYVYERDGELCFRTGWYVAPLSCAIGATCGLGDILRQEWQDKHKGRGLTFPEYVDFCIAANGFADIRPGGIVCSQLVDRDDMTGKVRRCADDAELTAALARIAPYESFATSGLLSVVHRLRAVGRAVRTSMIELGTLQDWVWQIPRDTSGHALVVPGIVEALRMTAEGLEKTTGTEWLDGPWGYSRPRPQDRRSLVS